MKTESQYLSDILKFAKESGTNKFDIINELEKREFDLWRGYSEQDVKEIETIKETVTN